MTTTSQRIQLVHGDITTMSVDAIVNAANSSLLGGGGVDGAIHRAAGPELLRACRLLGGCPTGSARVTAGYQLPAAHVIHTVGPVWHGGSHGEAELLDACYRSSLRLCEQHAVCSVAFPAISCGVYGYPLLEAARIALTAMTIWLEQHDLPERIIVVCYAQDVLGAYEKAWVALGL